MKKKIFIITGESSGDKIASYIINHIKNNNSEIEFLAIGGENIKSQRVNCIFDIKDIAFMGIIDVLKNVISIKNKIDFTIKKIIEFNPQIVLSIDSPDFSFRVLKKIKNINSNIKTIHLVAPQVWAWRENRKKKLHKFIDHLLLLFEFEKFFFDGFIRNTFIGHPFFDFSIFKINKLNQNKNKYLTFCPGSRYSELNTFMPIFVDTIKKINLNHNFIFHFPTNDFNQSIIIQILKKNKIDNFVISTNEKDKNLYMQNSILAISKSGTITLDVCKNQCPLIVVYKTSWINYLLIKPFVKIKFGNILNIIANKEVIPELIQQRCNSNEIFEQATKLIDSELLRKELVSEYNKILDKIIVPDSLNKISNCLLE